MIGRRDDDKGDICSFDVKEGVMQAICFNVAFFMDHDVFHFIGVYIKIQKDVDQVLNGVPFIGRDGFREEDNKSIIVPHGINGHICVDGRIL